jgi:pimeloyl-ACP methyl ester carboxylesterase
VGEGPDLSFCSGLFSNLDVIWEEPHFAHFLSRLASFTRLIIFDMRGEGLSDKGSEPPIIERQRDDIGAVMDSVAVESAIVFGVTRAASMSMLFAATHPHRAQALRPASVTRSGSARGASRNHAPQPRPVRRTGAGLGGRRGATQHSTARHVPSSAPAQRDVPEGC